MDTFEVFDYEACHGMRIVLDIHAAVEAEKQKAASEAGTLSPVECVAKRAGRRVDEINRFLAIYRKFSHPTVQAAASQARLSLSVVLDLANAVYPLRKHKDRDKLVAKLCHMLEGLTADQAKTLMTDTVKAWAGDSSKRPDSACIHKRVGIDGKRRFVAVLSAPIADRIDTILHRLAERIKKVEPTLQNDEACAKAFIQKMLGTRI